MTRRQIVAAYAAFFNSTSSLAESVAALQHGAAFRATLAAESNSANAQNTTARVKSVAPQSANVAVVTFSLVQDGTVLLGDITGYAVRADGRWQVAAQTFCNLLQLEGTAPRACSDKSITALPG